MIRRPQSTTEPTPARKRRVKKGERNRARKTPHTRSHAPLTQPRLGNDANNFEKKLSQSDVNRRIRGLARSAAARYGGNKRLRECGHKSIRKSGQVGVKGSKGKHSSYAGIATCGNAAACPVCAMKVALKRRQEIEAVLKDALDNGMTPAFVTLTASHHMNERLERVLDRHASAWKHVLDVDPSETEAAFERRENNLKARWCAYNDYLNTSKHTNKRGPSKPHKKPEDLTRHRGMLETYACLGWLKVQEVTYSSKNGWHPHFHAIFLFDNEQLARTARKRKRIIEEDFADELYDHWETGITRQGGEVRKILDGRNIAVDVRVITPQNVPVYASYLVKQSLLGEDTDVRDLAAEASLGLMKKGRGKSSRTPFQILEDIQENPTRKDIALWREWVATMHGRRQISWSKGFKALSRHLTQLSDEEIAAEEDPSYEKLVLIDDSWRRLRTTPRRFELLETLTSSGTKSAEKLLRDWDMPYIRNNAEGIPKYLWTPIEGKIKVFGPVQKDAEYDPRSNEEFVARRTADLRQTHTANPFSEEFILFDFGDALTPDHPENITKPTRNKRYRMPPMNASPAAVRAAQPFLEDIFGFDLQTS